MRILVISTHDSRGGAAKAAYRFSKEFINQGHQVCLYVRDKKQKDTFIKESSSPRNFSKIYHFLDFIPGYILSGFDKDANFTLGLFGENLNNILKEFKPDVINVHWTWKGFISFPEICRVSKRIPVIWTTHDCSPFSGGSFFPKKRKTIECLSNISSSIRKIFLSNSNITFVSPSNFLFKEYQKYDISKNLDFKVINNGVNTNIFKKIDRNIVSKKLGLDINRKYILFGAVNIIESKVKGGEMLIKVLKSLKDFFIENNIGLLSFGSSDPFVNLKGFEEIFNKHFGYIGEDKMVELLSIADVVLVPSFYENYPFVVMEALSCSTPVVAFRTGGIPEMISHKKNGYLAKLDNVYSFREGIIYCLTNKMKQDIIFPIEPVAKKYISLFETKI